jgi:hypothetical protein
MRFHMAVILLTEPRGKDIILFAGSTGVGKSVLVNLATSAPMRVDDYGDLVLEDPEVGLTIDAGPNSVTSFPQYRVNEDQSVYVDVAGFEDTQGTLIELQNMAFLRQVIFSAKSLNLMVVATQSDIGTGAVGSGGRGFIRNVARRLAFLPDDFLSTSVGFIINKVDCQAPRGFYDALIGRQLPSLVSSNDTREIFIRDLFRDQGKFLFMPKATQEFNFQGSRDNLRRFTNQVPKKALAKDQLSLGYTLNQEMVANVRQLFDNHIIATLLDTAVVQWKNLIERRELSDHDFSVQNERETKERLWREVKEILQTSPSVQVLSELVGKIYTDSMRRTENTFFPQVFETLKYAARMK